MPTRSPLAQRLLAMVASEEADLIALLSQLIQFPSENPPGRSGPIADFIAAYLTEAGIPVERLEAPGGHVNLLARTGNPGSTDAPGPSGPQGRTLIFCGHTDVVPVGDRSRWSFDPFSGAVRDGHVLGRGASDMKGGLAGILFACRLLHRFQDQLPGEVVLAAVDDEETGGHLGARWLLEEGHLTGDACLIAEPSSPREPTIGQKGSSWFRLTFTGRPAHGSLAPVMGESAILKAARATLALQDLFHLPVTVPAEIQEVMAASRDYIRRVRQNPAAGDLLDHVSVNVGIVQGGSKANVVPDRCVLEVDTRVPFGATPEQVMNQVHQLLAGQGLREGADYTAEPLGFQGPANYTRPQEPVVQSVLRAIAAVRGGTATPVLQWASSDARHFRRHGIPVLQYGPAELETIHGIDERVQVADVVAATKVYLLAALDYLGA